MEFTTRQIENALLTAARQTVEDMAFCELKKDDFAEPREEADAYSEVWLPLIKPIKGRLVLKISQSLLEELMGNIYGLDASELPLEASLDALAELSNTIAGRALCELTPKDSIYDVGVPGYGAGPATVREEQVVGCSLTLDGRCFIISIICNAQ